MAIDEEDTKSIVYLVTATAFGDAIFGAQLRRRAGLPADAAASSAFQLLFANLLRAHIGDDVQPAAPPETTGGGCG